MSFCLHNFNWPLINIVIPRPGLKSDWQIKETVCVWNAAPFQHKLKWERADGGGEILPLWEQNEMDPSFTCGIANMTRQHLFSQSLQAQPQDGIMFYLGTNISSSVMLESERWFPVAEIETVTCWNGELPWRWPCLRHYRIYWKMKPYPIEGSQYLLVGEIPLYPLLLCNYPILKWKDGQYVVKQQWERKTA